MSKHLFDFRHILTVNQNILPQNGLFFAKNLAKFLFFVFGFWAHAVSVGIVGSFLYYGHWPFGIFLALLFLITNFLKLNTERRALLFGIISIFFCMKLIYFYYNSNNIYIFDMVIYDSGLITLPGLWIEFCLTVLFTVGTISFSRMFWLWN